MPFRILQLVTAPIRLSGRLLQFSLTVAATPFRMLAPGKHRKDLVEQAGPPVAAISSAQHEAHPGMYSAADVQAMLGMVKEALRAKVIQILASISGAAYSQWKIAAHHPVLTARRPFQPLSLFWPHSEAEVWEAWPPQTDWALSVLKGQGSLSCTPKACSTQAQSSEGLNFFIVPADPGLA